MVRILGRYRNYDDDHAWLVECSTPTLVDAVRSVMASKSSSSSRSAGSTSMKAPAFEVPPPSFLQVLRGKR
jgi:hypothetical protein